MNIVNVRSAFMFDLHIPNKSFSPAPANKLIHFAQNAL